MGWPSLFAAVVILGGMQLMATSVIGEYIARIYVQAQARPLYNVAERLNFDAAQAPGRAAARLARRRAAPAPRRPRRDAAPASPRASDAGDPRLREGRRVVTRILIVGCGFPQLSLVRAAKRRGLYVVGADMNPRAVAVACATSSTRCRRATSTGSCDLVASRPRRRRDDHRAARSRSRRPPRSPRAWACRSTPIPRPCAAARTRTRCARPTRPPASRCPAFARCATLDEARAFARDRGFPLVVKPSRGWGQRGVARVDDDAELARAFEEARAHSASAGLAARRRRGVARGARVLGQRLDRGRAARRATA